MGRRGKNTGKKRKKIKRKNTVKNTGKKRKKIKRKKRKTKKMKNNAGSLKMKLNKTKKGRFISRRKRTPEIDASLEKKQMNELKKRVKKARKMATYKKAFQSRAHTIPITNGSKMESMIKWEGERNKQGYKMYSIFNANDLNDKRLTDYDDARIDGHYYVPKTKRYQRDMDVYTNELGDVKIKNKNIKSKSRSKGKTPMLLKFGLSIR